MLDSLTTLVLAALLFFVQSLLVWWITGRRHDKAVACWCAGSILIGTGIVLMGLRPWIAPWASFHGGNISLMLAFVFWPQSLRSTVQREWPLKTMVLWALLATTFYSLLHSNFEPDVRGLTMRLTLGALALYTAYSAWRVARQLPSHNAGAIAISYTVLGMVLWFQVLLHGGDGNVHSPFGKTWDASLLATVTLASSAVVHLCYAGMVLDRSAMERLHALRVRASAKETTWLNSQLRQLDRQRRMLLVSGSLAHELSQPMTAALTQAQVVQKLLGMSPMDPAAVTALLGKVSDGILRTSSILDRIRYSGHGREPQWARLDLREVARRAVDLLDDECRETGICIDNAAGGTPLWCRGDDVSLQQVLLNLLRNAIQAVEGGQRRLIQVECVADGDKAMVIVRDQGPGIPPDILAQVGEPFVGTRKEGLGLGLAISTAIAQQHLGELTLGNPPQGGAQAMLLLPLDNPTDA